MSAVHAAAGEAARRSIRRNGGDFDPKILLRILFGLICFFIVMILISLLGGCAHTKQLECVKHRIEVDVDHYDDLCAEESSGYEDMEPWKAHRAGVECEVRSIEMCFR